MKKTHRKIEISRYYVDVVYREPDREATASAVVFEAPSGLTASELVQCAKEYLTVLGEETENMFISPIYNETPLGKYNATMDMFTYTLYSTLTKEGEENAVL